MKEIKATAPTLEELYQEYKRLIEIAKIAFLNQGCLMNTEWHGMS